MSAGADGRDVFEYALLRVVPRIERGECFNAGVAVYCRARSLVVARTHLDEARLRALDPRADVAGVRAALRAAEEFCQGGAGRAAEEDPGGGSAGWWRRAARCCSPGRCTPG